MQKAPILAVFVLLTLAVYGQKETSLRSTRERRPLLFFSRLNSTTPGQLGRFWN